ncbi:hypothetical protein CEP53_013672 [Fusarium sp. AF-6]|nr:hypothetical protein CEP53_013672 [Fusarium sp. AF-6]
MTSAYDLAPSVQRSLDATKVDYVKVGSSGLRVSWPILGGMILGSSPIMPWNLNEEDSIKLLKAAYDRGLNTWDTANCYRNGLSEEIIGDQLGKTKDYVNQGGLSRGAVFHSVEESLTRLGTTYIDLLQIHRFDPNTPIEETMKALHDLVQGGKVRYLGASSMWATQLAQMQFVAEQNGWTKFISVQNYYNLCYREEEREMNRFCKATGLGILPWSPLYGGKLAKPLGRNESLRSQMPNPLHSLTSEDEQIIGKVEEIGDKKGWKMSQVALAWHKAKGTVPIAGMNSVGRVDEMAVMRDKLLTEEEIQFLEELYQPRAVVGHL